MQPAVKTSDSSPCAGGIHAKTPVRSGSTEEPALWYAGTGKHNGRTSHDRCPQTNKRRTRHRPTVSDGDGEEKAEMSRTCEFVIRHKKSIELRHADEGAVAGKAGNLTLKDLIT